MADKRGRRSKVDWLLSTQYLPFAAGLHERRFRDRRCPRRTTDIGAKLPSSLRSEAVPIKTFLKCTKIKHFCEFQELAPLKQRELPVATDWRRAIPPEIARRLHGQPFGRDRLPELERDDVADRPVQPALVLIGG